jgi:hypothetical protein
MLVENWLRCQRGRRSRSAYALGQAQHIDCEFEARVCQKMGDIGVCVSKKIIDAKNFVALVEKAFAFASVDMKQPFGATLTGSCLRSMPWIAVNRRKDGAVSVSAAGKNCRPARRVLTFERADHVIARWDQQSPRKLSSVSLARLSLKHSFHFEVFGRRFALVCYLFVFDPLAFVEVGQTGPFDCRNVDKYIFAAALRPDESIALLRIEPLDCADCHPLPLFGLGDAAGWVRDGWQPAGKEI